MNQAEMELLHWHDQVEELPNRMGQALPALIASSKQMDVLTGYFYFNGVPEVAEALEAKAGLGIFGFSHRSGGGDSRSMRVRALSNIETAETQLRGDASPAATFLPTLRLAIDRFSSLSDYTLRRLGRFDLTSDTQLRKFMEQVDLLREKLGDAYLDDLNKLTATTRSEVIVAIELRKM